MDLSAGHARLDCLQDLELFSEPDGVFVGGLSHDRDGKQEGGEGKVADHGPILDPHKRDHGANEDEVRRRLCEHPKTFFVVRRPVWATRRVRAFLIRDFQKELLTCPPGRG